MAKNAYTTRRIAPEGYVSITKPLANLMYNEGYPVTIAGNNVNSYHIFNGCGLGCTLSKKRTEELTSLEYGLDSHIASFMFYLEPELGYYPVFYVKSEDLEHYNKVNKTNKAKKEKVS